MVGGNVLIGLNPAKTNHLRTALSDLRPFVMKLSAQHTGRIRAGCRHSNGIRHPRVLAEIAGGNSLGINVSGTETQEYKQKSRLEEV
jgi:hypothetical protein